MSDKMPRYWILSCRSCGGNFSIETLVDKPVSVDMGEYMVHTFNCPHCGIELILNQIKVMPPVPDDLNQ